MTKDDILKEIRRTAKENGGIPLGIARFEKETGIKPYEWHRYWARFGDVQQEAGFEPNTLQGAFDDDYLLEKFISLIREINKFPTWSDVRVKVNNSPGFPNDKTFYRFGTVHALAVRVLEYAKTKKYEEVIKICQSAIEKYQSLKPTEDPQENIKFGIVYLTKSGRYYKIGRTNDIGRRHHEITIQLPEGLKPIHEIKTDDPSGVEAYWHRRFEDKRKQGEWFDLNASDVRAFRRWRKII